MDLVAVEADLLVQVVDRPVHAGAGETCLADLLEDSLICPFAGAHHRRENQDAAPFRQPLDGVHNFLGGLFDHLPPADGAVGDADPGEEQA